MSALHLHSEREIAMREWSLSQLFIITPRRVNFQLVVLQDDIAGVIFKVCCNSQEDILPFGSCRLLFHVLSKAYMAQSSQESTFFLAESVEERRNFPPFSTKNELNPYAKNLALVKCSILISNYRRNSTFPQTLPDKTNLKANVLDK